MNITTTETPLEISGSMPDQNDLKDSRSDQGSIEIIGHTAPEQLIDIPSLLPKLFSLLPGDRQLERRAHKLAWNLSKGRKVTCEWDNVFLSELTPAESRMPDDEFVALYPDHVKTITKKGGRPKKYRTAKAQKKGHAERQRRYRERKLLVISDVTKTPSQMAER
jgi:hypothetical protein